MTANVNTEEVISTVNGLTASSALNTSDQLKNIGVQALQNAVETANMLGKQAVRAGDLSIDRWWNTDAEAMQAYIWSRFADKIGIAPPPAE